MPYTLSWTRKREMGQMVIFLVENGGFGVFLDVRKAPRLIRPHSEDLVSDPQLIRAGLERWVLV